MKMTDIRIGDNCPRCDRETNHTLEIYPSEGKVVQRCGNCDLERHGVIAWNMWMFKDTRLIEWKLDPYWLRRK